MSAIPLEISPQDVKARLDAGENFLLLDCREVSEYEIVRIEGAVLLPLSELASRVGEIQEHLDQPVVVHCHLGGRSLDLAVWLRRQGFAQAQSMAGGVDRWAVEIDPGLSRY